ncbi:MAG: segregation/condensation protein A [Phycisphaerae bacterium]|nr:segregation/condensation protein A [Phycisphaerae bacterium]
MSEYRVNLDIFAGPLDLLLYLVRKDEVDIYDIKISRITEQYLHYIELLHQLDIDLAGDFLVMAATLMQIKSAMLLPKDVAQEEQGESTDDPRADLIRQLLEYKKFKDAANLLGAVSGEYQERFARPNTIIESIKPTAEPEVDMEQVSVWDLLAAFDAIMQATGGNVDFSHITDDTPIDLYQIEILHRLQSDGAMSFERIFEGRKDKLSLVGLFLALLELIRGNLIWVEQDETSKTIFVRSLTEEPAEDAVRKTMLAEQKEDQPPNVQQEDAIPITEIQAQKNTAQQYEYTEYESGLDNDEN